MGTMLVFTDHVPAEGERDVRIFSMYPVERIDPVPTDFLYQQIFLHIVRRLLSKPQPVFSKSPEWQPTDVIFIAIQSETIDGKTRLTGQEYRSPGQKAVFMGA